VPEPNLEQRKNQARELLRAARGGDAAAIARFQARHPRWSEAAVRAGLALHDAQLVVAREHGFPSWAAMKHAIQGAGRHTRVFVADVAYQDERAGGLMSAREAGVPQAFAQIREWHPRFGSATDGEIRSAAFTRDDARLVYAREHGFEDWSAFTGYVEGVARGERSEPFRDAFEAMRRREWDRLATLLREHPDLVRARGTNGNSLLNLAVSLAGRTCDALPPQAWAALDAFLRAGADVNGPNDRGWTPLHQAAYSNQPKMVERLLAAGARADAEAHGGGGTALAVALFWGHREAADVLARAAVGPANLRIAAGLGRLDLIDACFEAHGELTPAARSGRGFYRPHSGFPVWRPSDDRQEILDEALVWACKADRVEVLDALVARGADVNADPYRGTPLLWAAANDRLAAARWLLDHDARQEPATFGGPSHGEGVVPLHLAAQNDHVEMIRLLLDRGGDPAAKDRNYQSTPLGWAEHFGHTRAAELLRRRA
jgi:ankyrin repeat protein